MTARSRHADRRRAVALLYEADLRDRDPLAVLANADESAGDDAVADGDDRVESSPAPFVVALVEGVSSRRRELDDVIARYARGWSIDRMPVVDRNLLRVAAWELLWSDVPVAVVIDEAVELANELSTPDSGRFVNGVLAQVARNEPRAASL